ncbi:RAB8A [Hepatospora eriocheir]|uniref:RAB8A n=1 Tax=Hepatospora eriocheir TaxID=1081669 RepID=A0A1X0QEW1_9MICR|nr:RAB8A [Hepatospora eriocheir]
MAENYDYLFKVILIGDSGVGKSSIVKMFTDKTFNKDQQSTIGVDFKIKTLDVDNKRVKLQIWDTAGQEKFNSIVSNYYRGAFAVLVIFDVTKEATLKNTKKWVSDFFQKNTVDGVETFIIGNKIDLLPKEEIDENNRKALELKFNQKITDLNIRDYKFIPVSAKDDININKLFATLASNCMNKFPPITNLKKKVSLDQKQDSSFCC